MRALDFYQELFEKKSRQIVVGISREKIALHRIYCNLEREVTETFLLLSIIVGN